MSADNLLCRFHNVAIILVQILPALTVPPTLHSDVSVTVLPALSRPAPPACLRRRNTSAVAPHLP